MTTFAPALLCACLLAPSLCRAEGPYYIDKTANLPATGISSGAAGPTMDAAAADLNGDGHPDIVLAHEFIANVVLFNNGAGTFTNGGTGSLPQARQDSEDIAIADFDRDGDPDLVFVSEDDIAHATGEPRRHEYYLNDGKGVFTAAPFTLPDSEANAVATADLSGDGHPDLVIGNAGQNFLLINDGKGGFTDETTTRLPNVYDITQDIKIADLDGDGDLDIIAGNEDRNRLLINDGKGVFTDESMYRLPQDISLETRKVTVGDVDGDGDPDVFLANVAWRQNKVIRNRLYINDGRGVFTDETQARLPEDNEFTLDGIFVDVDRDGDPDIVTVNVQELPYKAYLNDGKGVFTEATEEVFPALYSGAGLAVLAADFNGDGVMDLYFGNRDRKDNLLLHTGTSTGFIDRPSPEQGDLFLFPNPCREEVTVRFTGPAAVSALELFSVHGQRVAQPVVPAVLQAQAVTLPLDTLPAGMYTIRICAGDTWHLRRFIKH